MPLKLIAPGKRKGNPFYLVRGEVGGRSVEVSTKTRDKAAAERFKAELELRLLEGRVPGPDEAVTFAQAADFYVAFRDPSKGDRNRIDKLKAVLGSKLVTEIRQADLVDAAHRLYPRGKNETKNRGVIKPAASILHYAARNEWCEWLRIERFEEGPIKTRASTAETARLILQALAEEEAKATTAQKRELARKKQLLVLWLFRHFNRVSDPLRLRWDEHISLTDRTYLLFVSKSKQWKVKPLHAEVFEVLANEPEEGRAGYLFPWRTRSGVYKWLRPLTRRLGVSFTPHMARHYGGKMLNAAGRGLKTIMGALDHSDVQSSARYQDADLAIVHDAIDDLDPILGNRQGKTSKRRRNPPSPPALRRQRS